jgi:hypothetical protein
MQKNYIPQAFFYTLAVAGLLVLLSFFEQERTILGYTLKPVSIFSDIVADEQSAAARLPLKDTLAPEHEPCPPGVVCFRNFTGTDHPLDKLFDRLLKARAKQGKVRIAWYGD